jgi:hypothetical protein
MVQLVGFGIIAAIVLIYFVVQYARGEISYSLGEIMKILLVTIVFSVGWLVIPVFSILAVGGMGIIISIFSVIISSWIGYKLLKNK